MFTDWALAKRGSGVFVLHTDGRVTLLEFNAFLQWIAAEAIQDDDLILSAVYTDGNKERAVDLRVYGMVRAGEVRTDDLPLHTLDGVLAEGEHARVLLRSVEANPDPNATTLLRPASLESDPDAQLLHPLQSAASDLPPEQLLRSVEEP